MPTIHIQNNSAKDQEFEVHGFAQNPHNITVKAHGSASVTSPDKQQQSGAIIALHGGHEGEQAEVTFNGYPNGANQYYDISYIVGGGGNLTIEQSGAPNTRKGDATFMQDCNAAWHKASADKKKQLEKFVHVDGKGKVERIEPPKNDKGLEEWVRTFAHGVYVGVGAWKDDPGNAEDNKQSSATPGGNKDLLMVYSDIDTNDAKHDMMAAFVVPEGQAVAEASAVPAEGSAAPVDENVENGQAPLHFTRAAAAAPPGIQLTNKSNKEEEYFFFNNYWNGNGTAGANFDHPEKPTKLKAGASTFVQLDTGFKGRVQRGKVIPATWVEFQIKADNGTGAWGDISLQQGYDGPAMIRAMDGSKNANGFTNDILPGAPAAAKQKRSDGVMCLASTMGNWMGGPNQAAIEYEQKVVGQKKAYITGGSGTDVVNSKNLRLAVEMY